MKRRIFRLGLFLLLAAIINVAVAWGCAGYVTQIVDESRRYLTDSERHAVEDLGWTIDVPHRAYFEEQRLRGWRIQYVRYQINGQMDVNVIGRHQAGYPASALQGTIRLPRHSWDTRGPQLSSDDLLKDWNLSTNNGLDFPLLPIWPGFAINTIFYAAILWLPVAGLGALRRRRRIKRGLCPACAYPVGDSPVCTECGKNVNPAVRMAR